MDNYFYRTRNSCFISGLNGLTTVQIEMINDSLFCFAYFMLFLDCFLFKIFMMEKYLIIVIVLMVAMVFVSMSMRKANKRKMDDLHNKRRFFKKK